MICPFFGDQPFWARRIAALCAGPPPLDWTRLSAERLAAALNAAQTESLHDAAQCLGALIRREHGVAAAIEVIESTMTGEASQLGLA